jgi:hypothetical protein
VRGPVLPIVTVAALALTAVGAAQRGAPAAPEVFTSPMQTRLETGALAGLVRFEIDRYTPDFDHQKMTEALRIGGYSGFLHALRKAPAVGRVAIGDISVPLRWARQERTASGRTITLVAEKPVYFVGGGRPDPRPRAGFEVSAARLTVDEIGLGTGTFAAAARMKLDPTAPMGVAFEYYSGAPIELTSVSRVSK